MAKKKTNKSISAEDLADMVTVIGEKGQKYIEEGKEYQVAKADAIHLLNKGAVKLK